MSKRSIAYLEIPATNRAASAEFYSKAFGWELQHVTEPSPYTMGESGNTGIGLPDVSEQTKVGNVLVYIASDDLAADLKTIESLGGKTVVPHMDIPGFGAMAVFLDPAGNQVALWKDANGSGG